MNREHISTIRSKKSGRAYLIFDHGDGDHVMITDEAETPINVCVPAEDVGTILAEYEKTHVA